MSSPARFLSAVDASQFIATDSHRRSAYVLATFEKLLDLSAVVTAIFVANAAYSRLAPDGTAPYALPHDVAFRKHLWPALRLPASTGMVDTGLASVCWQFAKPNASCG